MIQFYLLSILFNAIAGFLLVSESAGDTESGEGLSADFGNSKVPVFLKNESFRLILGVLTAVMGLLKILSATQGDIPVIGDIIPAVTGLVAGFILIFEFYHDHSVLEEGRSAGIGSFLLAHKKVAGFAALAAAALHFLFPAVLLL
ncbi:MAG: hypothetical protein LBT16_12590 [Treponema sp.]|jgi:hypothetical protein|nr:hypothetical protein [Treponema sp.]